jgi:uncharacterized membrane protein
VAQLLHVAICGLEPAVAAIRQSHDILTSGRDWLLVVVGGAIGFGFAELALCLSTVSFSLLHHCAAKPGLSRPSRLH